MFLFTTPAATRTAPPAGPIIDAIRQGAEQTGTSFEYLLNTAKRESALDPSAKAPTSSATGLFQFIEQTWLGVVKAEGPKLGLSDLAGGIATRSDGVHVVADGELRETILKLREDPRLASLMAGALTQQNRESLLASTGREPSSGELYMAHVLGPRGATNLIRSANESPSKPIAADMPEAAAANRSIFFDRRGRARAASELYAVLSAGASAAPAPTPLPSPAAPGGAQKTVTARSDGPALHGLFRTETRAGPISDAVAKLWRVNNAPAGSKQAALSFFPRADGSVPEEPAAPEPVASTAAEPAPIVVPSASAPLPPARPRRDGVSGRPLVLQPLPAGSSRS